MPTGKIIKKNLNISPPHPHNCLSMWMLVYLKTYFFKVLVFSYLHVHKIKK